MTSKKSRVHPKYKTRYRVGNWPTYDRSLVSRGDVTVWLTPEAVAAWKPRPSGRRGAQPKYSDLAIEATLTVRLVFGLPLRQAEGFVASILRLMGVDLEAPDHTTLSRRGRDLDILLRSPKSQGPIHLIIDSSGLSIHGEGEWAAAKRGGKGHRGWKKLHLGVDANGVIVAHELTDRDTDDATVGVKLIKDAEGNVSRVTADTAYDTNAIYDAATQRGARVVIPPIKTATSSRRKIGRSSPRDRTIHRIKRVGRRRWKKEAKYHQQARVENTFYRYKGIFGGRLRARCDDGQRVEATLACNVLNRMTELGRPISIAIRK